MYLGELWRKLVQPVQLPAVVRELLPVSTTRALMAALILFVWTRPTFHLVSYPVRDDGLMGWQLTGIGPLNWLVPVSAAVLLIAAWEGYRRVQAASLVALWLQCIGISIWVPLGAIEGAGWPGVFLLGALVSAFRAALVAVATTLGLQRALLSIGAAVVVTPIVVMLLLPYWYSGAYTRREENPFYVVATQGFKTKPEEQQVARPMPRPPPSTPQVPAAPPPVSPPVRVYEDSPLAWLQSSVLVASAVLCLPLAATRRGRSGWYAIGALLLVAALDERFMFHEKTTLWLFTHPLNRDAARAQLATAAPMLAYAIAGLCVSLWLWRVMRRGRPWIVAAATIAAIALAMDVGNDGVGRQVIEELLELAAETLFLCALLITARAAESRNNSATRRIAR